MDTQVNVIFIIYDYNSDLPKKEIPVKVYPQGSPILEKFSFNEYEKVEVEYRGDDIESFLEIETFDRDEVYNARPYERVLISPGGDKPGMLVPQPYTFAVHVSGNIYVGEFNILPKTIGESAFINLKKHLEEKVKGLTLDLYKQRLGVNTEGTILDLDVLIMYDKIRDNYKKLINCLDSIVRNPLTSFIKVYSERPYSNKPDLKSERWLVHRGASINANPHIPSIVYEKHTEPTYNTTENIWIKKIISSIDYLIRHYENCFIEIEDIYLKQQKNKESQLSLAQESLQKIKQWDQYKYLRKELKSKIRTFEKEIKELDDKISAIKKLIEGIVKFKGPFSYYKNDTWLKNVEYTSNIGKPTLSLLKDRRYSFLYQFYNDMMRPQDKRSSIDNTTFSYKRTYKLFEYYILTLVIEILEKNFVWKSGWLADRENGKLAIVDILPDTKLIFENEESYIEVVYDSIIDTNNQNRKISHFEPIDSHTRPDIRLSQHKKSGELISSLIIEVKNRGAIHLFDKYTLQETNTIKQLKGYYRLGYFDAIKNQFVPQPLKRVLLVYPKQIYAEQEYKDFYGNLVFIQVEPSSPDTTPYGFGVLQGYIEKFLRGE